jgi:hypothetical protein
MLLGFCLLPVFVYAQSITGSLTGSIIDPTDAAIAGASLTLRNPATGAERTLSSDQAGRFFFGTLQPGSYTLSIEQAGFKRFERTEIPVSAAETVSLGDIRLEVGQTTETVEVRSQAALVQTQTSERAGVLTGSQVESLALRGRNVMSLVSLLPGVVDLDDPEQLATNWNFYVQGNRRNTNNVSVDGATVNAIGNNFNAVVAVSMDAVAEVKVLTSNYQAEHGRMSGANVHIVTKSGSREFHGLASYFKRNEVLNANDFFNNFNGRRRPLYRFDTWNYNIGGPVYIPGKFNRNKEKLFFFWSQEFWPLKVPNALTTRNVPTELERQGNFSQTVDLNNARIIVRDPYNSRTPFPNNIIPANRVNPNGRALLNVLPLPNFLDRNISRGNYNYVFQDTQDIPKRTDTLKLDYNLSDASILSFSYSARDDINDGTFGVPAGAGNYNVVRQRSENNGKLFLGRWQKIFNPTLINELNVSYSTRPLVNSIADEDLARIQRDKIGFNLGQFNSANNPLNIMPNTVFGGVPNAAQVSFDGRTPLTTSHRIFVLSNNMTKTLSSHTLKAGFYLDRIWAHNQATAGPFNGAFNFTRNVNNPLETDYAYSNAALGVFNQYDEPTGRPFPLAVVSNIEWFVQDNWRVNKRFTVDIGLRFYKLPQSFVKGDETAGFWAPAFQQNQAVRLIEPALDGTRRVGRNPNTGQILPPTLIGLIAPGAGNPANGMISNTLDPSVPGSLMRDPGLKIAPRIGFAWDVAGNGKTSVRGGIGLFYNRMSQGTVLYDFTIQPPIVNRPTVFYGEMDSLLQSAGTLSPQNVLGLDLNAKVPKVMNFSLSVQRDIGMGTILDVGYAGSLGRNLLWQRNLNAIPFGTNFRPENIDPTTRAPFAPQFLRPFPGYQNINIREPGNSSNYHSLQVSANRRFRNNFQYGASWTWSKSLDYEENDADSISMFINTRQWHYGPSDFDRTHVVKINFLYDLPNRAWSNILARGALNGWQVSGITTFSSGAPFTVGFSTVNPIDITGSPTDGARIVVTGDGALPKSERTFSRWINTSAFRRPNVGEIGNAGRNHLRGPGIHNYDLTAFKNFAVRERFRFQLRGEFYNAFNHTQFTGLNTAARFDATGNQVNQQFGQLTAARPARRIQLALRVHF